MILSIIIIGDLLSDFNNKYNETTLKQESIDKLNTWLKDQDILFLFEHDLIIKPAVQYYSSNDEFYEEYINEYEDYLQDGLSFNDFTREQLNQLESDKGIYIPANSDKQFYHVGGMGFALRLPKKAILREYKEYLKDQFD